jgi:hypothetical protein
MRRIAIAIACCAAAVLPAAEPGIVSNISIVSPHTEDVSSLEAWERSCIRPGMSEAEKAAAVFTTVLKFRHQEAPPNEFRSSDGGHVHDPIKTFNVYGYGQCCCASCDIAALARHVGLQARGWGIINHSVPEVRVDGAWGMYDASLMTWFPRSDGRAAGVEEIAAGVMEWYTRHPDARGDERKLRGMMRGRGWKTAGPAVLAGCRFYDDNGWFMAATHGWYSTMQEYADRSKLFLYEYGYTTGYRVNVQLRRGERLVREWSNRGLHVNQAEGGACSVLTARVGEGQLRYTPGYGDLANGRVGNGTLGYAPPLADGGFRGGASLVENLVGRGEPGASPAGPALQLADAGKPGVYVVRMPTSYVYLGGRVAFDAVIGAGGRITVAISTDHGEEWTDAGAAVDASGPVAIDLTPAIRRRYDYLLRLVVSGAGSGVDRLAIDHDLQHSQRALPALAQGVNTVRLGLGAQEGTITIEGHTGGQRRGNAPLLADFDPHVDGLEGTPLRPAGGKGSITFRVATPGDLARIRFGCHYRARDARDGIDLQVSFDGGRRFTTVGTCPGGVAGNCVSLTADEVPPGAREALVRFALRQVNTTCLFDLRIDADYREPQGGWAPVQVTYVYDQGGVEQRATRSIASASEPWDITCAQQVVLKSLIVERAP